MPLRAHWPRFLPRPLDPRGPPEDTRASQKE